MSYVFPLAIPRERVVVTSEYGTRARGFHNGIDLAVPAGTEILANHDGTISKSYNARGGNQVIINGDNIKTGYAHLLAPSPLPEGTRVQAGDVIGQVGSTGTSTGPHLHFTLRLNNSPDTINPKSHLFEESEGVTSTVKAFNDATDAWADSIENVAILAVTAAVGYVFGSDKDRTK